MPKQNITRNSASYFPFSSSITEEDKVIRGSKLPSYEATLRCLIANRDSVKTWIWGAAQKTISQVAAHYGKANVKMISHNSAAIKLQRYFENDKTFNRIKRMDAAERESKRDKVIEFRLFMASTTMPFWAKDAMQSFSGPNAEEDREFLRSMMTDRLASYGGIDRNFIRSAQKKAEREKKRREYEERVLQNTAETGLTVTTFSGDESDDGELSIQAGSSGVLQVPSSSTSTPRNAAAPRKRKPEFITITLPKDFLQDSSLVSTAVRCNMSPSQQLSYLLALFNVSLRTHFYIFNYMI